MNTKNARDRLIQEREERKKKISQSKKYVQDFRKIEVIE